MNDGLYFQFYVYTSYFAVLLRDMLQAVFNLAREKRPRKNVSACNLVSLYSVFSIVIILSNLRTCACFAVTSVSRAASTAVWANSIGALCIHVTGGGQGGAFIHICRKEK